MDPYSNSGYKTDRARSQSRTFKKPSTAPGFLAPGFPVEVAPAAPPPPPPIVPVVAGGAAAGAVALPIAVVVGTIGGLALGLDVRRDIQEFRKKSKLPFYDTDHIYSGGVGWKTNPHWDASKEVMFDKYADDLYMDHLYDLLQNYVATEGGGDPYWVHHSEDQWVYSKVGANVFGPHVNGRFTHFYGFDVRLSADTNTWNYAGWQLEHNWAATGNAQQAAFPCPPLCTTPVGCGTGVGVLPSPSGVPFNHRYVERFADPATQTGCVGGLSRGVEVTAGTVWEVAFDVPVLYPIGEPAPSHRRGTGTPSKWRKAKAKPRSQPSLDEQIAGQKLPRGKARRGYYVVPPINYPFTLVHVEPGAPPVTVPDVVIEPGVGTGIVPPGGPPAFPDAGETYERKPRNRFVSGGAMFMSIATEANDFVTAMHKGLPKKYRSKTRWGVQPDVDIILLDIINHWDKWDADLALEHFVNNQIEDHVLGKHYFGRLGKLSGAKKHGFGVRGTGAGAGAIPIPEIHFANGQHSISVGEHEIDLVTWAHH